MTASRTLPEALAEIDRLKKEKAEIERVLTEAIKLRGQALGEADDMLKLAKMHEDTVDRLSEHMRRFATLEDVLRACRQECEAHLLSKDTLLDELAEAEANWDREVQARRRAEDHLVRYRWGCVGLAVLSVLLLAGMVFQ